MPEWLKEIRKAIGHDLLIINSAGGWIEKDEGKVLLQKRSAEQEHWGLPGGVSEVGESAEETAVREIKEVTGLVTEATELPGVYSKYFLTCSNGHKCQTYSVFFKMRVIGGQLRIDGQETHALKYFSLSSLPNIYYQQHRDLIDDMQTGNTPEFR